MKLVLLALLAAGANGAFWKPTLGLSFQWTLQGPVDLDFDANVFDIDLFDNNASTIDALHRKGRIVVCYVSSQFEDFRSDSRQFAQNDLGRDLDGWPGEKWLNIKSANVRRILAARVQVAKSKNCDALEWDNVDPHQQNTGFSFSLDDTFDFLKFLANETHNAGMAVALKNNVESLARLGPLFDFAINEECFEYDECAAYKTYFVDLGKPVFNVEYKNLKCSQAAQLKITSLLKKLDLKSLPYTICNKDSFDNTLKLWPWSTSGNTAVAATTTPTTATLPPSGSADSTAVTGSAVSDSGSNRIQCRSREGTIGNCATADECELELHPASSGATGCERLPPAVQCCAPTVKSSGSCRANGSVGVCTATGACAEASGTATPASAGATGCESLPSDIQCCVFRALLHDDATKPSSAAQLSALAGFAIAVLTTVF